MVQPVSVRLKLNCTNGLPIWCACVCGERRLPDKCGLSSWLPGSYIEHGVADSPLGPFVLVNNTPSADGKPDPLNGKDRFATNPHVAYVKSEKRYLLFFNGREWPANDLTNCWPSDNKTDTDGSHFHGGGACTSDNDCAGAFAGTDAHQGGAANICGKDGKCSCEHHSMGPHCNIITETVNVASALSPNVSAAAQELWFDQIYLQHVLAAIYSVLCRFHHRGRGRSSTPMVQRSGRILRSRVETRRPALI